jgi:hypothetical protein
LIPIPIAVLAVIVVLLVSVSRTGTVAALPDAVFEQVNDLHNWEDWSPWAKLDPAAKGTYEGPPAGVGASFAWAGNRNIGEGRMTITESRPSELVRFKLDFLKPFKETNSAEFAFKPEGGQTRVTWTMSGQNSFFAKAIGLIINCDNMIGKQFEKGLEQLNLVTQTAAKR